MTLTEKKQKGWQRSMRLLIDANVILDVLQNREPHVKDSAAIWRLCETRQAEGFISALTFANLVYIMRRELNPGQIEEVLQKLSLIFTFTELSPSDLQFAPHGGHWCVCQRPPGGAQRPPSLRYFDRLNNNNVMLRCPLHNSVG